MNLPKAYRTLLRLYPSDYRARFALEMLTAFKQTAEQRRLQSSPAFMRFFIGEFIDLLLGAGAEWIAKLTTDNSIRGRCLPDLRMMRPPGVPQEVWFAGACPHAREVFVPDELMAAQDRISMLIHRTVHAIANHDFPGARRYSGEELKARDELRRLQEKYNIDGSTRDNPS